MGASTTLPIISDILSGSSASFNVGAQVADYEWGKDITKNRYLGNNYLGGNPQMAGRYQGEYAASKPQIQKYTYHKTPKSSKILGAIGTIVGAGAGVTGSLSSAMGGEEEQPVYNQGMGNVGGYPNSSYYVPPETWSPAPSSFGEDIYDEPIQTELPIYDTGMGYAKSGIHIKESKRGTFTRWCKEHGYGGVTSACISAAKGKGGAVKKKAVFAQNAKGWKKGEDGMLVEDVQGRDHEEGGEKRVLNGVPVEVEDNEWIIRMDDGSIAVLNESQQRMLQRGKPLGQIVNALPKVSNKAQNGIDIPPEMMENYRNEESYDPFSMYQTRKNLEKAWHDGLIDKDRWLLVEPSLENDWSFIRPNRYGRQKALEDSTIETTQDAIPSLNGNLKEVEIIGKKERDFISELSTIPEVPSNLKINKSPTAVPYVSYSKGITRDNLARLLEDFKQSQKWQALSGIGSSLAQGISAGLQFAKNRRERPPEEIRQLQPSVATFTPINPESAVRNIKAQTRTMSRLAMEMGRPELITSVVQQGNDALTKLFSEVEGINAQSRNAETQLYLQSLAQTNQQNITSQGENIKNKFLWDTTMATAQQQNLETMFASGIGTSKAVAQAGNNVMTADVVKYLLNTGQVSDLGSLISGLIGNYS